MPGLDYVKVVGRFGLVVGDTLLDPNEDPDTLWCDSGEVWFTPLNTYTKVAGAFPVPATLGHSIIKAEIDADGYLSYLTIRSVNLVDLTSESVNPQIPEGRATHRVEFKNVRAGDTPVEFATFNARLAPDMAKEGVLDLTLVSPVPAGGGTAIVRGEQGTAGVDGDDGVSVQSLDVTIDGRLTYNLDDGTIGDAGELPVGPGGSNAGVAGYINSEGPTKTALNNAIEQSAPYASALAVGPHIQRTRVELMLKRRAGGYKELAASKTLEPLLTADASNETPQNLAGMPAEVVDGAEIGMPGRTFWKITRTAETDGDVRLNITSFGTPPIDPVKPDALGVLVYLPQPVSDVQLVVGGTQGTWSRRSVDNSGSSHSSGEGGLPLRQGVNLIRWGSGSSSVENLVDINRVEVRIYNVPTGTSVYVEKAWVERSPRPRAVLIFDWAAKTAWEQMYPELKARGIPVTLAARVNLLGKGTYPNEIMSVADVKAFLADNPRNRLSIHSSAGNPTSGLTGEQLREEYAKVVAGLMSQGLYSDDALIRAAWTQNLAPNAPAVFDQMVLSRTYRDSVGTTPWPPTRPLDIGGVRFGNPAGVADFFGRVIANNSLWVKWVHGVTPDGDVNHISEANFASYLSAADDFIAAGGEFTTLHELAEQHPILHHPLMLD